MKLERRLTVVILRSTRDVFDYLDEFKHDTQWRPAVVEMRRTSSGTFGVGSTVTEFRNVGGGRILQSPTVVTEYTPPTAMSFQRVSGPIRPLGRYLLELVGNDNTRLTFTLAVSLGGVWNLAAPIVALFLAMVMRGAQVEFATLTRLLEAEGATSQ